MKLPILSILSALIASLHIHAIGVSYDESYDNASGSLASVSCSDGSNGLMTKNYPTQGSLPSFPRIGGASVITGWNSASCGSCWSLTYNQTSIYVLAMDHANQGFNIAKAAMDILTGGHAAALGRIHANVTEAAPSKCGM